MQGHCVKSSSKSKRPKDEALASTKCGSTEKDAPDKSTPKCSRVAETENPIINRPKSTWYISPLTLFDTPSGVVSVSFRTVCEFFHLENLSNASREEVIFLHILFAHLASEAKMLAAILPWSVERPLRALLEVMNESGGNYTKQTTKRKRPSGFPVSSEKR